MELFAKEQIKVLLSKENILIRDIATELGKILQKEYSASNLSHKIRKGTIRYDEVVLISRILGYEIDFKKIK